MVDRNPGSQRERPSSEGVKDRAKDAARGAKHSAEKAVDKTTHKAEELAAEAKDKGKELAHEGKERARSQADGQKDRVSHGLRSVADALRRGQDGLPEDQRQYGRFLGAVADRAEDASRYLENRDVDSLTREVRSFARDHTPIFLSGAFTVGMLGARFLKSSTPPEPRGYRDYPERGDTYYGREPVGLPGSYDAGAGAAGSRGIEEPSELDYQIDEETRSGSGDYA